METQTRLEKAYSDIKARFENNLTLEPFYVVKDVDAHRNFWKPKKIDVLLLAESHVYTSTTDYNNSVNYDGFPQLNGCPNSYVRLVYCLGYGERKLVEMSNNSGTPQFWKIFASCVSKDYYSEFRKILSSTNPYSNQRIQNKIQLLEKMKERGVWLVDASIVALYNSSVKPSVKMMQKIIEISWDQYVSRIVLDASPRIIIVIGKGVAKTLEYKLNKINIPYFVQPQPNSRLTTSDISKTYSKYYELCNSLQNPSTIR